MAYIKKVVLGPCEATIYKPGFPKCGRDAHTNEGGKNVCANHKMSHANIRQRITKKGVPTREYY